MTRRHSDTTVQFFGVENPSVVVASPPNQLAPVEVENPSTHPVGPTSTVEVVVAGEKYDTPPNGRT